MCAVRSVSSSASLALASFSHWVSFVSRSLGIWGIGVTPSRCWLAAPELALNRLEDRAATAVRSLVQLHRGELGHRRLAESRDHGPGIHALEPLPGLEHSHRRSCSLLGARLGGLEDQLWLLGDMFGRRVHPGARKRRGQALALESL